MKTAPVSGRARGFALVVSVLATLSFGASTVSAATPTNDTFENATEIEYFPFEDSYVDNWDAYTDEYEPAPSCSTIDSTVWYRLVPTRDYSIRVRVTPETDVDAVVAVYEGTAEWDLTELACADSYGPYGIEVTRDVPVRSNHTYYIQVGGYYGGNTWGEFTVKVRQITPTAPANDMFANAAPSALGSLSYANTAGATIQSGEPLPSCALIVGKSVWYRYRPATTRTIVANTVGSSFDTVLAVYRGSSIGSLTRVACSDDRAIDSASRVKLTLLGGVTYYFQASGYDSASGSLVFRLKTP